MNNNVDIKRNITITMDIKKIQTDSDIDIMAKKKKKKK